jgi:hypothetical protein
MSDDNANKQFLCSYKFDDAEWSVTVWASTWEEAEMKLRVMGQGTVDGVVGAVIPADGRCPKCGHNPEQ